MRWQVDSPGEFYDCKEKTLIYFHPASGDTHLVSEFAAHLIQQLISQPMDTDHLIEAISSEVESTELADLANAIPKILDELAELDIVTHA